MLRPEPPARVAACRDGGPTQAVRRARAQALLERVEVGQHAPHAHVRVDAEVEAAAVRRAPLVVTSNHAKPLCARQMSSAVGSVTIAASGR